MTKNEVIEVHDFYDIVKVGGKGRPKKVLNAHGEEWIIKLASIGTSQEEICDYIGMDFNTAHNTQNLPIFSRAFEKGMSDMKNSLRSAMFAKAIGDPKQKGRDGNPTMMIFLAKNVLGMTDNPTITIEGALGIDASHLTFDECARILGRK